MSTGCVTLSKSSSRGHQSIENDSKPISGKLIPVEFQDLQSFGKVHADTRTNMDISTQLSVLVKNIQTETDWRKIHESIKHIEQLLEAHSSATISLQITEDLYKVLKAKLNDFNKNIVLDSLKCLHLLTWPLAPNVCRSTMKSLLPITLSLLSDQKNATKRGSLSAVLQFNQEGGNRVFNTSYKKEPKYY